ncbi:hypothetical protein FACS189496_2550 [Bacilli bacterium]|nr:hypothetical protein FACS189496_2550 [Bacilli bacterium]
MKNSKIFLGMLVLVLAFGFVLTGCDTPTTVEGEVGTYGVAHGDSVSAKTIQPIAQWYREFSDDYTGGLGYGGTGAAKAHDLSDLIVKFDTIKGAARYYAVVGDPETKAIIGYLNDPRVGELASPQTSASATFSYGIGNNPVTKIDLTKAWVRIATYNLPNENPDYGVASPTTAVYQSGSKDIIVGIVAQDAYGNGSKIVWSDKITFKWEE